MSEADNAQYSILIVDDLPANIQVLGSVLRREGYSVSFATSGWQALDMVHSDIFDLILLDVMMPEMDGFDVCRKLKEIPEIGEVPVIFLTARTSREDIVKGLLAGAMDYVTKPFHSEELLARVRTHLALKRSHDAVQRANRELTERNEALCRLNEDLQKALAEIRTLRGLLPICANCKKIRKDGMPPREQASWVPVEVYLEEQTKARLTHSICPECIKKLYPEFQQGS